MGQTITSITDMVSYAGDLRRAAKQQQDAQTAQKIQRVAQELETTALKHISQAAPNLGKLLDTFV
jgi:hypothetical protein